MIFSICPASRISRIKELYHFGVRSIRDCLQRSGCPLSFPKANSILLLPPIAIILISPWRNPTPRMSSPYWRWKRLLKGLRDLTLRFIFEFCKDIAALSDGDLILAWCQWLFTFAPRICHSWRIALYSVCVITLLGMRRRICPFCDMRVNLSNSMTGKIRSYKMNDHGV